jgi:pyridoxine/pyridoxamine 5'-phosphate oxidase
VPVWGIWTEETFFFATDAASRKARNLHLNPQVVVHLESGDEVVILEGRVEVVDDRSLQARIDAMYFAKYAFHMEGGPICRVQVDKALAWRERDFPSSATRFQMQD